MPVLSCGRLTEQKHGYSFSNIISRVPQSDHYHFKYVATLRIVGVFVTIYQGEWTKPLPSSKVKHVHSAGPEPRYLVGKVPSVHVFENINKSHRYELIMKSQAAWVQSGGGGGGRLRVDSWTLASVAEIGRNDLQFHWQKRRHESHSDIFIGCYVHTHVHSIRHTVHIWIQWPPEMTQIHILESWNVKNRWWLIWNANSWGWLCCIYCCQSAEALVISRWHQLKHHLI